MTRRPSLFCFFFLMIRRPPRSTLFPYTTPSDLPDPARPVRRARRGRVWRPLSGLGRGRLRDRQRARHRRGLDRPMKTTMSRRSFLGGAAALTVAAGADVAGAVESRGTFNLPARGEFLIRSGYVMTMDPTLGDIARGDVHVKNGAIVAVGAGLKAGGADAIDGRDMIVLPGFVDTHWHMWNTLLRSMAGDKRELGYFPTVATLGKLFTPGDMYQ